MIKVDNEVIIMKLCDKEKVTSYDVWFGKIENERKGINFKEGYVPAKYM